MSGNVYVAPRGSAWEVKFQGSSGFTSIHRHRESAFAAARSSARKFNTTVVICTEELWDDEPPVEKQEDLMLPQDTEDDLDGYGVSHEIMPIMILKGSKALLF